MQPETNSLPGNENSVRIGDSLRKSSWHLFWGVVWIAIAVWLLWGMYRINGRLHLQLALSATTTEANVLDYKVGVEDLEDDRGRRGTAYHYTVFYSYRVDGKTFKGEQTVDSEPDKKNIQVEYDPHHPSVSRIHGSGPTGFLRWCLFFIFDGAGFALIPALVAAYQLNVGIRHLKPILNVRLPAA